MISPDPHPADDGAPSREGLALAELKELRAEASRLAAYAKWLNNVRACEHPYGSIRGQKAKDIRAVLGRIAALEGVAQAAMAVAVPGTSGMVGRLRALRAALLKAEESR